MVLPHFLPHLLSERLFLIVKGRLPWRFKGCYTGSRMRGVFFGMTVRLAVGRIGS